jgi:hypothetical protein
MEANQRAPCRGCEPDAVLRPKSNGRDFAGGTRLSKATWQEGGDHWIQHDGQESLNANLHDPEALSATVIIYGSGFDQIQTKRLERLRSPVLAIARSEDADAVQAAINFFSSMKATITSLENCTFLTICCRHVLAQREMEKRRSPLGTL